MFMVMAGHLFRGSVSNDNYLAVENKLRQQRRGGFSPPPFVTEDLGRGIRAPTLLLVKEVACERKDCLRFR